MIFVFNFLIFSFSRRSTTASRGKWAYFLAFPPLRPYFQKKIYFEFFFKKKQKKVRYLTFSYFLPQPEINNSIKMEVGIEDCLHIEFEYNRSKYHLKDVVIGKIYVLLVQGLGFRVQGLGNRSKYTLMMLLLAKSTSPRCIQCQNALPLCAPRNRCCTQKQMRARKSTHTLFTWIHKQMPHP